MKRYMCILLGICFLISLTACGDPTPQKIDEETVKIVVICDGDAEDETSQAAAYETQLQTAAQMMGLQEEQYEVCDGIAESDSSFTEKAAVTYIKDGYSIVFGAEAGYAPVMKKLAAKYPRVTFVQIGDADASLPNYYAYHVKTYEGAYLCGLVAGGFAKTGKLGMLAEDLTTPETHQMANAFLLGAQVRKPQATLFVTAAKGTTDYASPLSQLVHKECEGVLITVDSKEAVDYAKESNMRLYTVYGRPNTDDVAYRVEIRHQGQMADTFQAVLSGKTPYYNHMRVGYADGFLQGENGFEEDSADGYIVPDAAKTFFMKEQWDVFSGVKLAWDSTVATFAETPTAVKDAEGNIRIPAGAGIPTDETLSGMDWWMQGVTVIEN
ncbi:MAG: BMP family ABC transporter substrate-binding protein [Clostridia bacterium]|nr:BMP family ABC transporter substrate-binding protein [Clostridia bacterium]